MLDGIEALTALARCGTVGEAAVTLRLTQSAVTKRIQSLQNDLGFKLTARDGRRIRLTPEAQNYLDRARPLLVELQNLRYEKVTEPSTAFSLAMADSIASSWGPAVLREVASQLPQLKLRLHAHRSALVVEAIRMGRYHIGLCTDSLPTSDLVSFPVTIETFVLLNSKLGHRFDPHLPLITIEENSATWRGIQPHVTRHALLNRAEYTRVESFTAALQMVAAGFGNGLVPLGLAKERGVNARSFQLLTSIQRPISLLTRKSISQLDAFQKVHVALQTACRRRPFLR